MLVMSVYLHKNLHVFAGFSSFAFKNSITLVKAVIVYIAGAVSLYIDLVGKNRIECVILLKIMESWVRLAECFCGFTFHKSQIIIPFGSQYKMILFCFLCEGSRSSSLAPLYCIAKLLYYCVYIQFHKDMMSVVHPINLFIQNRTKIFVRTCRKEMAFYSLYMILCFYALVNSN